MLDLSKKSINFSPLKEVRNREIQRLKIVKESLEFSVGKGQMIRKNKLDNTFSYGSKFSSNQIPYWVPSHKKGLGFSRNKSTLGQNDDQFHNRHLFFEIPV